MTVVDTSIVVERYEKGEKISEEYCGNLHL